MWHTLAELCFIVYFKERLFADYDRVLIILNYNISEKTIKANCSPLCARRGYHCQAAHSTQMYPGEVDGLTDDKFKVRSVY
jgi:hypothetical protein